MRELFVETIKDSKSSKNYRYGELQINSPRFTSLKVVKHEKKKLKKELPDVPKVVASVSKENLTTEINFNDEAREEILSMSQLHLTNLKRLKKEMDLLKLSNPLMQEEYLDSSYDMLETGINRITQFIETKNIKELNNILEFC